MIYISYIIYCILYIIYIVYITYCISYIIFDILYIKCISKYSIPYMLEKQPFAGKKKNVNNVKNPNNVKTF